MNKGDLNSLLSNMIKKCANLQPKMQQKQNTLLCFYWFPLAGTLTLIYHSISSEFHNWINFIPVSPKFEYGLCPLNLRQHGRQNGRHHLSVYNCIKSISCFMTGACITSKASKPKALNVITSLL